jgi:uncharacterized protein
MTPQEQQLVADLFDRLASLEGQRRDPDADRLIREGLGRAPNSVYALVQTVLVQDETLKMANARIEELERAIAAPAESSGGGFLDSVRNMLGGQPRASVPSVKPGGQGSSGVWGSRPDAGPPPSQPSGQPWGNPQGYPQGGYPPPPPPGYPPAGYPPGATPAGGGHSFLGTAAATVAGVVGGAMLLNGIRSMMGGSEGFSPGHHDPSGGLPHSGSPWDSGGSGHGGGDQGSGNLSQDAGLGDVGGGHRSAAYNDAGNNDNADDSGSFLGGNVDDLAGDQQQDDGDFDTGDLDGGDGGDFDTA